MSTIEEVAAFTVFDKLVANLSTTERRAMLDRIAGSVEVPEHYDVPDEDPTVDMEAAYNQMGFFRRLLVMITALLTGREKLSVVEEYILRDIRRKLQSTLPYGYDTSQDEIKAGAVKDFQELSAAAHKFSTAIGRVMGRERRAFIAFLVGLHAADVQMRLIDETDPFTIGARYPDMKDNDVRRKALAETEEIMSTLPPMTRQRVYADIRTLHHLLAISGFPFDRIIGSFLPVPSGEPVPVPVNMISGELARLSNIFVGFRDRPSATFFEALGLYQDNNLLDRDDDEIEHHVSEEMESLVQAYERIVGFGRAYPLADMVRVSHQNVHYRPTPIGGGEDWFAQWKGFWKERIEASFRRFAYVRKVESLIEEARDVLSLSEVREFPGYPDSSVDGIARHGLSLGLAHAFINQLYRKYLAAPVATLFREGEFYKADNRTEMDRVFHGLQKVEKDMAGLEVRLQESGDLGQSLKRTEDGSMPADAAAERRYGLAVSLDSDAAALLHRLVEHLSTLGEILAGVLYGTVGGRYDTISNLPEISGSKNPGGFASKLEDVHVRVKAAAHLISDLQNAEALAAEARSVLEERPVG